MKIKIISRERDSTGWQLFGMGHLKVKPPIGITGSLYLAIPKRAATAAREGILMVVSLVMPCLNQRGEKTPTQAGCLVSPSARRLGLSVSIMVRTRS